MERNIRVYSASLRSFFSAQLFGMLAVALLASCSSAPPPTSPQASPEPKEPTPADIIDYARTYMGAPYQYGGTSRKGLDCSGLVYSVYDRFNVELPRTVREQVKIGAAVQRTDLIEGDLVFFKTSGRWPVGHVGIYVGDGKFIHASTTARRVRVDTLTQDYFHWRFAGARRVMN
ncbi:MAG: C40 family peptidase [bacterium]|nr:C40 family peptidase [bacterium]